MSTLHPAPSLSSKSREIKSKGKTSSRRRRRDISRQFMSIDDLVELERKNDYEERGGSVVSGFYPYDPSIKSGPTASETRRLRMFYHVRNKENPQPKPQVIKTVFNHRAINRSKKSEGARSSAASGDSNPDGSDPEPEQNKQHSLYLFDQQSLADLLCISKKTLQNAYSNAPYTLPEAIQIPHARGPRWTVQAVQVWLNNRPKHAQQPLPIPQKRKAGRPRIAASAAKGGAK